MKKDYMIKGSGTKVTALYKGSTEYTGIIKDDRFIIFDVDPLSSLINEWKPFVNTVKETGYTNYFKGSNPIELDRLVTGTDVFEIICSYSTYGYYSIFGNRKDNNTDVNCMYVLTNRYAYGNSYNGEGFMSSSLVNTKLKIYNNKNICYADRYSDGVRVSTKTGTYYSPNFVCNKPYKIFGPWGSGNAVKIYNIKLWKDGIKDDEHLVYDLYPFIRKGNAGMINIANNDFTFYTNLSSQYTASTESL